MMDEFKPTVLVVDDEKAILLGLEETLKSEGYKVITAADGPTALALAIEYSPDLVLLDIMLPVLSGYEVCRKMRAEGIQSPVIMLTARGDEFDKLHGFEVGADDYVVKPFSLGVLLARVKAVLARGERRVDTPRTYTFGKCRLDMDARTLAVAGESVTCTRTEFDLLAYFCRYPGKALSREILMRDVWGTEYYGTQRSLDSFVATLRKKVEVDAHAPLHILTVHGVGYKFDPDAAD
jgi:two-component system alkaline phosphatase synthesis response regulator PhoP